MIGGLDFSVVRENLPYFFIGRYPKGTLGGVGLTLYLAVVSLALSFIGGLVLGLLSVSRNRLLRWGSMTIIQTIRGMPLLMVIFWMFFLLPALLGGGMSAAWTIIVALTLFTSANVSPASAAPHRTPTIASARTNSPIFLAILSPPLLVDQCMGDWMSRGNAGDQIDLRYARRRSSQRDSSVKAKHMMK